MDNVTTYTLHSWPCPIISPVWSFEKKPVRTLLCQWWGTAKHHVPVVAEKGQKLLPGGNTLVQRWKKTATKMATIIKNNYAFRNDVVKFCEIFTCLLSSSKQTFNAPIVYIMLLHSATHFSACWHHLQGVSYLALQFSVHQLAVNTCPNVCWQNAAFSLMYYILRFHKGHIRCMINS